MRFQQAISCLVLSISFVAGAETFRNPARVPLTVSPPVMQAGDLNGDGLPDLMYSEPSFSPYVLHFMMNAGNRRFVAGPDLHLPADVGTICRIADLDRDGKGDLVCPWGTYPNISGDGPSEIRLFKGNGDGTFQAPIAIPLPNRAYGVTSTLIGPPVDLNGDGYPDIPVQSGNAYILVSNGNGGYTRKDVAFSEAASLAIYKDVNGDGKPDLLTSGPSVALGNGDGTFAPMKSFGTSGACDFHDMNGDGKLDAVCSAMGNHKTSLSIYKGVGDGSFETSAIFTREFTAGLNGYEGGGEFMSVAMVLDVDGDGLPDILAGSFRGPVVLRGLGNLQFADPKYYVTPLATPSSFSGTTVDVDGDGLPDMVGASMSGISIAYGSRTKLLDTAPIYSTGAAMGYSCVADYNSYGVPDLVTTGSPKLALSLGVGDGTFQASTFLPSGSADFSTPLETRHARTYCGDFDGDGKPDVMAYGPTAIYEYQLFFFHGNGDGTFATPVEVGGKNIYPEYSFYTVADLNGDGRDDLLFAGTSNLTNAGGTSFTTKTWKVPDDQPVDGVNYRSLAPAVGDLDGDGKLDAAWVGKQTLYVAQGDGTGGFGNVQSIAFPSLVPTFAHGVSAAICDLDGDGKRDVLALISAPPQSYSGQGNPGIVLIYFGRGDGTFEPPVAQLFRGPFTEMLTADFDKDGIADVLLTGSSAAILHGSRTRTIAPVFYDTAQSATGTHIADFNRDGFPDLLFTTASNYQNGFTVLLNEGNAPAVSGSLTALPEPSLLGDTFTLVAGLQSPRGETLAGQVTFQVDGATVGKSALSASTAAITLPGTLNRGPHTLRADWPGDLTYAPVVLTGSHTVSGYGTQLSLSSSLNPAQAGDSVDIAAVLGSAHAGTPANGTVVITDNGVEVYRETLTSASLPHISQWITPLLSYGTHAVLATYSGDASFDGSLAKLNQTVEGIATSVSLVAQPSPARVYERVTLRVTLSPSRTCPGCVLSGHVVLSDGTTTIGDIVLDAGGAGSTTVVFKAASLKTLRAEYSGSPFHLPASTVTLLNVVKEDTATTLTSSPNPTVWGEPVTFTAKVSLRSGAFAPLAGVVIWSEGASELFRAPLDTNGQALWTTSDLPVGSHAIRATFASTDALQASQADLPQTVNKVPTSTILTVTPASVFVRKTTLLTAVVTTTTGKSAAGQVAFLLNGTEVSRVAVQNGHAEFVYSGKNAGTFTATANYLGDDSTLPSASADAVLSILPSDFKIVTDAPTVQVRSEYHLTTHGQLISVGDFADVVAMTASQLPPHMTVVITPVQVTVGPQTLGSFEIYIDTDDVLGYRSGLAIQKISLAFAPLLLLIGCVDRRRRAICSLVGVAVALIAGTLLTGCSGKLPASTPPGTYTIQLTGVGTQSGVTHTYPLIVDVRP